MNPTKAEDANAVMKAPPDEPDVQDLPIRLEYIMGQRVATSTWQPDEEERARLAAGAPVKLSIYGEIHPPLLIWA